MSISKVVVVDGNNISVRIDRGVSGPVNEPVASTLFVIVKGIAAGVGL